MRKTLNAPQAQAGVHIHRHTRAWMYAAHKISVEIKQYTPHSGNSSAEGPFCLGPSYEAFEEMLMGGPQCSLIQRGWKSTASR